MGKMLGVQCDDSAAKQRRGWAGRACSPDRPFSFNGVAGKCAFAGVEYAKWGRWLACRLGAGFARSEVIFQASPDGSSFFLRSCIACLMLR
jgi:hypothetical protein